MPAVVLYRRLMGAVGLAYLLDDEFTDARPAGGVNATPAVPGPGTRTVVDTNGIMSTAGGVLVVNGTPAANDRFHIGSTARMTGRVFLFNVPTLTTPGAAVTIRCGWSPDGTTSNALSPGMDFTTIGTVRWKNGLNTVYTDTDLTAPFLFAFVQRAVGGLYLAKIGANWLLRLVGGTDATATMFAKLIFGSVNAVNFTYDSHRVPQSLYISSLWYDSFTRANGALGSSESVGPDGQGIPSLAWTGATWTIVTNAAINTPTLGADVVVNGAFAADTDWAKGAGWTIAAGKAVATAASSDITASVAPLTANVWYQVQFTTSGFVGGTVGAVLGTNVLATFGGNSARTMTGVANGTALAIRATAATLNLDDVIIKPLTLSELLASVNPASTSDVHARVAVTLDGATSGKQAGLCLNLDSAAIPANLILAYLNGFGNAILEEWVAGARTIKISAAVTYSAGALLYVIRRGTSAWLLYNDAQVGTVQTMTANTNKLFGLFSTSSLCSLDAFEVWPDGGNGEHAALGAM